MGFFDDLSSTFVSTTKDLGKMAQDAGDMAKLQYEKKTKEAELIKLFAALGERYFDEISESSEEPEIQMIKDTKEELIRVSKQIMELKGGKACPKCKEIVPSGSAFCPNCGAKIDEMFEE